MLAINNCTSQTTKKTPYEMVLGQSIRIDHEFWLNLHKESSTNDSIINEEDLPDSFVEKLNTITTLVSIYFELFINMSFSLLFSFRPIPMVKAAFMIKFKHLHHLLIQI